MNQKGFSLVELKVCCGIIAVLIAIASPNMGGIKQSLALRGEVSLLHGNLQRAKMEAIKRNSFVVFHLTPGGYEIFVDDGAGAGKRGDWIQQTDEKKLVDHKYRKDVTFSGTTFTANRTRFNGRVGVKAGRVILENRDGARTQVVVSIVGRIRVEKI